MYWFAVIKYETSEVEALWTHKQTLNWVFKRHLCVLPYKLLKRPNLCQHSSAVLIV